MTESPTPTLKGYTYEDIDPNARELILALGELGADRNLSILALTRALVMIGNTDDLDLACSLLDLMAEEPFEPI